MGSGQNALVGTKRSYMWFQQNVEAPLNLPVRRDVANSQAALTQTPGQYRVTSQGADSRVAWSPFFFQDPWRNFLIVPRVSSWIDDAFDPSVVGGDLVAERRVSPSSAAAPDLGHVGGSSNTAASSATAVELMSDTELAARPDVVLGPDSHHRAPFVRPPNTKYSFHIAYHPYVSALISILNGQGLDQMLRREVQLEPHLFVPGGTSVTPFSFEAVYAPSSLVAQPHPLEEMDFTFTGAYSSYNWELFFHAPLLIADRLSKNQRFRRSPAMVPLHLRSDRHFQPARSRSATGEPAILREHARGLPQQRIQEILALAAGATRSASRTQRRRESTSCEQLRERPWKRGATDPFKPHLDRAAAHRRPTRRRW